jgi:uncharacterized protein DUF4416
MGAANPPKPVKYFVAFLAASSGLIAELSRDLATLLGEVDGESSVVPWSASKFYQAEMGADLHRGFLSFAPPRSPAELAGIKLGTQKIEERYRRQDTGGRRVNLDPGYLDSFKVVLASTKNAGQRVYLDGGIYAEVTLSYRAGGFHRLPYTYADYLWPTTLAFMTRLRAVYLEQLRQMN